MEWNCIPGGKGVSTGSSFTDVHCPPDVARTWRTLESVGSEIDPAVMAVYRGELLDRPSREQNSRVKVRETDS